ncbi:MAG: 4a-hydroxytetrahydrobiopterin dehydratase [Inhella sp.]|jgi:4a-hydroxytetrahydrobiopterin dehydratase|uniref:4a-hydroxytetrahydrobiopterin dehydratase n=1 Tax=Inhella sp. TaxID=1921806 RepID=UPI0022C24411|nr:4a-hydroxytetrahydrobiopterin dehydratase [Inhella sp.]MCZ8234676.1 4a-hydroxytetrahydrobiopterin dehydratase [Inhella sp.]
MNLLTAACTPNASALGPESIEAHLAQLPGWTLENGALVARFRFDNFREVMDFATAVAEVADGQDHHPEMLLRYRDAELRFSTHSAGNAVTMNDVICAAQVSHLPEATP